jgi:hypothetical protein
MRRKRSRLARLGASLRGRALTLATQALFAGVTAVYATTGVVPCSSTRGEALVVKSEPSPDLFVEAGPGGTAPASRRPAHGPRPSTGAAPWRATIYEAKEPFARPAWLYAYVLPYVPTFAGWIAFAALAAVRCLRGIYRLGQCGAAIYLPPC